MRSTFKILPLGFLLGALLPAASFGSEWVVGRVSIVDDYRTTDSTLGIVVTLAEKTYYSGGSVPGSCTKFRIVVGQENVTADIQKSALAVLLTAQAAGTPVRLLANPSNVVSTSACAFGAIGIGDVRTL